MNPVANYLETAGLTQAEFAARVGCHPSRISHLVTGIKKPSPEISIAIESAAEGAIRCEDLLPELHWMRHEGRVTGYFVPAAAPAADAAPTDQAA